MIYFPHRIPHPPFNNPDLQRRKLHLKDIDMYVDSLGGHYRPTYHFTDYNQYTIGLPTEEDILAFKLRFPSAYV